MESPEEEQSQRQGDVGQSRVVTARREEHPDHEGEDHTHIFVHTERHRVKHLEVGVDAHNPRGEVDHDQLQYDHGQRWARRGAEHLRREAVLQSKHVPHHQDVRHKCHGGNVEVGSVQFVSGLDRLVVTVADGPVGVDEGEHEQPQLLADVRVVHSEVILARKC